MAIIIEVYLGSCPDATLLKLNEASVLSADWYQQQVEQRVKLEEIRSEIQILEDFIYHAAGYVNQLETTLKAFGIELCAELFAPTLADSCGGTKTQLQQAVAEKKNKQDKLNALENKITGLLADFEEEDLAAKIPARLSSTPVITPNESQQSPHPSLEWTWMRNSLSFFQDPGNAAMFLSTAGIALLRAVETAAESEPKSTPQYGY